MKRGGVAIYEFEYTHANIISIHIKTAKEDIVPAVAGVKFNFKKEDTSFRAVRRIIMKSGPNFAREEIS